MGHLPFWKPAFVLYYVYTDILLLVYSKKILLSCSRNGSCHSMMTNSMYW